MTEDQQTRPSGVALLPRRRFLVVGVITIACLPLARSFATAVGSSDDTVASFITASIFLTGRSHLDPAASVRAWTQLIALDPAMTTKVSTLLASVQRLGLTDMTAFLASPLAISRELRATARTIVSAWYLGHTGLPVDLQDRDTTGFVTYRGALMFGPTIDATVIPSYSRAGPDYWAEPPAGTPRASGLQGRGAWQHDTVHYDEQNFGG